MICLCSDCLVCFWYLIVLVSLLLRWFWLVVRFMLVWLYIVVVVFWFRGWLCCFVFGTSLFGSVVVCCSGFAVCVCCV